MSINAQPFNPTFKLVGNLVEDQVLVYDSSENAFVNSTNTGGGAGAGFDAAVNEGTGLGVWKGSAGTTLQFKTLLGGSDITITESGDSLIIASTVTETMQTGTNLGTGTGIFDSKDGTTHALKFKSLAVGAGLTLTDDGAGTLTLVNTIAAGTSDADLTLSNLSDNATARTNLGVYSKTESDAKYHKHDDAFVPSANNTFDIGSSTLKYNDIYAETFQGTAVLADNLTTSGTTGQVLTYNGSSWAAADPTGSTLEALSNVSNVAPQADQHLTWNAITNLWTPSSQSAGSGGYQDSDARNAISVSGDLSYEPTTGVISYTATPHFSGVYADLTVKPTLLTNLDGTVKQDIIPDTNIAYDIGSDTKRFKDLYLSGNTISLGSALMSASSSGGISLPSGTTIGPATYGDFRPIKITDGRGINPNFNGNPVVANSTIIDQATYLNAVGSFPDTNFVPSVYSATQDGSNNITAITIVTANEYGSELQDYPGINTDYLMAIDAGIDITNPAEIAASSQQVELSAGVISASIGGTSFDGAYSSLSGKPTIPTAVSELTNDSGFITTDTDTTYTAGTGLTLVGTVFSNTAPDQTVALSGSGATTVTGTYPNFTIASTDTDTNTTYVDSDWTHNALSGVSANEHIDWTTDQGSTNIHPSNYTDTDTNTTYTAGPGITLTGTEFSMTAGHFDGAFSSLSGVDTPVALDDNKVLYYDHATTSFKWKTTGAHFDGDYNSLTNKLTAGSNVTISGTNVISATDTNTDTLYTAGTGLLLTGTVFSNTSPDQTVALSGTGATTVTGTYPNFTITSTDTDTTYASGNFTHDDLSGVSANEHIDWTTDQGATNIHASNYTDTDTVYTTFNTDFDTRLASNGYANSNVDSHLNQSNPTDGFVLSWTGGDYAWVSNGAAGAHFDGAFSSLTGVDSAVAGDDGKVLYYDHASASLKWKVDSSTPTGYNNANWDTAFGWGDHSTAGYLTSETDSQTLSLTGTTLAITGGNNVDLGVLTIDDMADVNITSVSDGQFLKYDNASGDWLNETVTIPSGNQIIDWTSASAGTIHASNYTDTVYANSDVDTHLNQSNPTDGYVLSWTSGDYAWVSNGTTGAHYTDADARLAISGTTGLSYNNTTGVMALNASVGDLLNVSSTAPTDGQVLKWDNSNSRWAPAADTDTDTVYTTFNTDFDTRLATKTTADVSEGTNKYFTDDRARQAISATGDINYNSTTGVISYTASAHYANSDVDTHLNQSNPTDGYVLSWTSGDYAWVADTDTTYTNVSEFTNDSGYLISGDLSGYAQTSSLATVATTGAYSDLSGTPSLYANSDVDSHLNQSNLTSGYVLSWNGSDYAWVSNAGGGATDKIEEGNSSVEVIDGGANGHVMFNTNGTDRWQVTNGGHILPETNAAYDLGSADKKVRHLFLSNNSLYIEDNTLTTSGTNLLFNTADVMDYDNLKNKPSIPAQNTGGPGIQVNAGVVSLDANLSNLSNVSSTSPNSGEVLKWDGSEWAPGTDLTSGSSAMNDLSDVDTTGITSGQYLQWNGSAFVASTVSGGGASAIDDLSDVDTTTSSPSNGDVLTWVQADSEWAPAAPSGGSGGGSAVEYFKVNYATNGNLTSITNATSGVSATILSATGGDVEISFSGTNYPPAGILIYGYAYGSNEYVIMPLNKDITTRKVAGGGSAGSPIAFGTMGSVDLTLKLRENDTGASRSFGTDTHAWIMFTVI